MASRTWIANNSNTTAHCAAGGGSGGAGAAGGGSGGGAPLRDLQLFGDCELAVLAASREEYDAHAKLVRAEYANLTNNNYVELRIKVSRRRVAIRVRLRTNTQNKSQEQKVCDVYIFIKKKNKVKPLIIVQSFYVSLLDTGLSLMKRK